MICSVAFIFTITTDTIHPIDEVVHFTTAYNMAHGNFDDKFSVVNLDIDRIPTWGNFSVLSYLHVHFDDDIVIQSRLTRFDGIKMEVAYEIYKKGDTVLCTKGTTGHCFLDRELKPIRMKRRFPDLYERLKELVKE